MRVLRMRVALILLDVVGKDDPKASTVDQRRHIKSLCGRGVHEKGNAYIYIYVYIYIGDICI